MAFPSSSPAFRSFFPALGWWGIFLGIILIWLPAGAFAWEVRQGLGGSSLWMLIRDQWTPRLGTVWKTNLLIALIIATLSTGAGAFLHRLLLLRNSREHRAWLSLYALGLIGSPYFVIQGWLNLVGPNTWLHRNILPAGFNLYSPAGYVSIQVLLNSGLALLICHGSRALLDRKYADCTQLYSPSWRDRLRTSFRLQFLPPLLVSFSFIFLLVYWHYDAASMLQQNLLPLELMTAFGSFYDNGQAAAIAVPACLSVLPVALVLAGFLSPLALSMKAVATPETGSSRGGSWLILAALPLLTLGVSLAGLAGRFSSLKQAWESLKLAQADFGNTAQVGIFSGLLLSILSLPIAWHLRVHAGKARWILPFFVMAFSIPAVVNGIGFIHLRGWMGDAAMPEGPLRLVALNTILWLPVCILLSLASLTRLPVRWIEEIKLLGLSISPAFLRIVGPFFIPLSLQLFMVGFALSIREVPASLLNYSPDGGTIAITVETMLHFDQPNALSALCLAQFVLVAAMWGGGAAGLHFLKKRMPWVN